MNQVYFIKLAAATLQSSATKAQHQIIAHHHETILEQQEGASENTTSVICKHSPPVLPKLKQRVNSLLAALQKQHSLLQKYLCGYHCQHNCGSGQEAALPHLTEETQELERFEAEQGQHLRQAVSVLWAKLLNAGHLSTDEKLPDDADIRQYQQQIAAKAENENQSIRSFWDEHMNQDTGRNTKQHLLDVIHSLRLLEQRIEFHSSLAVETAAMSEVSDYSDDNFAYGSTPFTTWYQLMKVDAVQQNMQQCITGGAYMVWGSSTGWLLFFASIVFGCHCIGYEILSCLAEESRKVVTQHSLKHIEVFNDDLLNSNLQDVRILFLTNQCWDEDLSHLASLKIAHELPPGAVCIEYTGKLSRELGPPVACLSSPVSWNEKQKFYVYQKSGSSA